MAASADDINSTLQNIVRQLGLWVAAFNGRAVFGTFTLSNATTTVIGQPNTAANSVIAFTPTNATAALTQRSAGVYLSALAAGTSFSVSTQSGTAQGTETFSYIMMNPS